MEEFTYIFLDFFLKSCKINMWWCLLSQTVYWFLIAYLVLMQSNSVLRKLDISFVEILSSGSTGAKECGIWLGELAKRLRTDMNVLASALVPKMKSAELRYLMMVSGFTGICFFKRRDIC